MAHGFVVYVIRHLPTAGNIARKYIGWTDEPIATLAEWDVGLSFQPTHVVGSDLQRARQSAALYFPQATYEADERWRECHFGDFEGKTYADLEKDKDYRAWIVDPYGVDPRGGESLAELETRVLPAFGQLPTDAVVVTHGGPIRAILTAFSPVERAFWSWDIPHGTGYCLEWHSEKAFKEGQACTSISAVPIMANGTM